MITKIAGDYLDAFGYWNGHLYIADRHHADILKRLIDEGATWEQLMANPPVFGWLQHTDPQYSYYDEETDTDHEIENRPRDEISVLFNTDTGAPKPTQAQMEPVLKAISKHYGIPAFNNPSDVNMDLWQEGTSYDMGVDSYEYNLRNAPMDNLLTDWDEGDRVKIIDPNLAENGATGTIVSIDRDDYDLPLEVRVNDGGYNWYSLKQLRKISANGWYKWIYNPEKDDYQEWMGDQFHYHMAKMLWPQSKIDEGQWWGGTRKVADPYFDIGYFPPEFGNLNRAKRYMPGNLLQNLMNRHIQEQNDTMSRGNYE